MKTVNFVVVFILALFTPSLNYSISLNFPFIISNQSNIAYMQSDNQNYFIQFVNGTVIKYNPTLTTSQVIVYP